MSSSPVGPPCADKMTGGLGDDTYIVDNAKDAVTEAAKGGTDAVDSSVNYTLGANVENLLLIGTAALGTGNTFDNVITGNDFGDRSQARGLACPSNGGRMAAGHGGPWRAAA